MAIKTIGVCFLAFVLQSKAQEADYKLQWHEDRAISIAIEGSIPNLKVKRKGASQHIIGKLGISTEKTTFKPIVPFTNGLQYHVLDSRDTLFSFIPDLDQFDHPEVLNIFPLSDTIPENLLKFYFAFTEKMEVGKVYEHLSLYAGSEKVEGPFIKLSPELWNARGDILTVWIDPGRIKRDLGPNRKFGPVLEEGRTYKLVLEKSFRSSAGQPMISNATKEFLVSSRDVQKPQINELTYQLPEKGTKDLLNVLFSDAMDFSLVSKIQIYRDGLPIKGSWKMIADRQLTFWPEVKWLPGSYRIEIDSDAEDLAGNNFNRLFDVDLMQQQETSNSEVVSIFFEIN